MGGFFNGLWSATRPQMERLQAQEDDLRKEKQSQYVKIIDSPDSSPEMKQWAQDEISKLYGGYPETKKHIGKVFDLHKQVSQIANGATPPFLPPDSGGSQPSGASALPLPGQAPPDTGWRQATPQETQQSQATQAAGPGQQPDDTTGVPIGPKAKAAMQNMNPQQRTLFMRFLKGISGAAKGFGQGVAQGVQGTQPKSGAEALPLPQGPSFGEAMAQANPSDEQKADKAQTAAFDQIDKMDATPEEKQKYKRAYFLEKRLGLKDQTLLGGGKMTDVTLKMKDGREIAAQRDAAGNYYLLDHTKIDPDTISGLSAKPSSAMPRFGTQMITLESAKQQKKAEGTKFSGIDGEDIDLDALPSSMVLQPVTIGGKLMFLPIDPANTHLTVGNEVIGTDKYRQNKIGQDPNAGVVLGQARTGTQTVSPQTVFNPATGQYERVAGQRTPDTPGIQRTPVGGSQQPTPQAKPKLPLPSNGTPSAGSAGAPLAGIPAGQMNAVNQRATPVRLGMSQIFGDPANPNLKSLSSYADLADDPKASARIATAVRLARNGMLEAETQGGHIGATVGPVSVGTGGLGQWLTTSFGLPVKITEAQNSAMQNALAKMSPREREAFNALMSTYGTVIGLRSLTRASAAQASVNTIENEIPLIGFNTKDKAQFIDKLERLGEEIQNGSVGVPKSLLDTSYIQQRLAQLKGKAGTTSGDGSGKSEDLRRKYNY